jgi:hypothetical protein
MCYIDYGISDTHLTHLDSTQPNSDSILRYYQTWIITSLASLTVHTHIRVVGVTSTYLTYAIAARS